jgi:hypothetical protein
MVFEEDTVERVRNFVPEARSLKTTASYFGWISDFIMGPFVHAAGFCQLPGMNGMASVRAPAGQKTSEKHRGTSYQS